MGTIELGLVVGVPSILLIGIAFMVYFNKPHNYNKRKK